MGDGAVAAGGLAEHAAPPGAAAAEALLDQRHHLLQQDILPRARRGGIDVLVAAPAREAVGEGDDHRRHLAGGDEAVEPLRSEELREGTARVSKCRSRWSPDHDKTKTD